MKVILFLLCVVNAIAELNVYYINLDHRTDRRKHMESLLQGWEYERVSALTIDDADGIITPSILKETRLGKNDERLVVTHEHRSCSCKPTPCTCLLLGGRITRGAAGCASSHVLIWKKIAQSGISGLILEDDIDNVPTRLMLDSTMNHAPTEADLLYLGTSSSLYFTKWTQVNKTVFGGFAYVLRPSGAQKLLSKLPIDRQCDSWMSSRGLNQWAFYPFITTPSSEKSSFGSDVQIL